MRFMRAVSVSESLHVKMQARLTGKAVSEPAAQIEPVKLADDPIPFIKFIDPPISLILRAKP